VGGSLSGATSVSVNAGGFFAGAGTVNSPLTVNPGGTLLPGNGLGTLTATKTVAFGDIGAGAAPMLTIDLQNAGGNSLLALTGTGASGLLSLASADSLNLVPLTSIGAAPETFTIATFASLTGLFDSILVNGGAAQSLDASMPNYVSVSYLANSIQVSVANLTAVPEPRPVVAALAAGAGLLGWLRPRPRRRLAGATG
jgi:hypothetical protein